MKYLKSFAAYMLAAAVGLLISPLLGGSMSIDWWESPENLFGSALMCGILALVIPLFD